MHQTGLNDSWLKKWTNQLPFKWYAALCLLMMGVVFYSSYGFANWLSAQRAPLPEIAFPWEYSIPFWAWTIVPYWSLNLFYAASVFVCRNRVELHGLLKQLLLAQAIAITFFILLPLQFSWPKPESHGISGALFHALAGFDQPYNQAPSLHIILVMILGHFYYFKLPLRLRKVWLAWLLLIAFSVLTTYQHHFIDIPTGVLVGALILWGLPIGKPSVWQNTLANPSRQNIKLARYYLLGALFLVLLSCLGGWFLWLLWGSVACIIVVLIYANLGPKAFQKMSNCGQMSFASQLLLAPYLLAVRLNRTYWLRNIPKSVAVTEHVSVGSILASSEFHSIVDVCAEYPCDASQKQQYALIPLLDMVPPSVEELRHAAEAIQHQMSNTSEPILVCCALGYSRSIAVVLTWLVRYRHCSNLEEALNLLKIVRPQMVISTDTRQLISEAVTQ